ncbi:MAG: AEC family transporter [Pseudomonadales bacterium]|nr:AEC family transporter [Pseudomonadales bacterium]
MLVSLEAILPLFLLIALGYGAKRTILDIKLLPGLNLFVYYFAVPALLFNAARQQSIHDLLNVPALAAITLAVVITSGFTFFLFRRLFPSSNPRIPIIQCLNGVFSNFAYMGIPLTFGLLGESAYAATISIVLLGNILIINGSQLFLEALNHHSLNVKTVFNIVQQSLLRNPIFLSTVGGLLCSSYDVSLPHSLQNMLQMLAPAAIPVALFCLGASLQFRKTKIGYHQIFSLVVIKLAVHPAMTLACFYLLGIDDSSWLLTAVLLCALPTGALAHVMALKYQAFDTGTTQVIVFSTILSLASVSLWVKLLL